MSEPKRVCRYLSTLDPRKEIQILGISCLCRTVQGDAVVHFMIFRSRFQTIEKPIMHASMHTVRLASRSSFNGKYADTKLGTKFVPHQPRQLGDYVTVRRVCMGPPHKFWYRFHLDPFCWKSL